MTSDLVGLVADLIPRPLGHHISDWAEREDGERQAWARDFPGATFEAPDLGVDQWRRERAARAILAALGMDAGEVAR